jgi:hypothetical protein
MKPLTKTQTKIIYISGIIVFVFLVFLIFVYFPQTQKLSGIKKQLVFAEADISQINAIAQGRAFPEAVRDLNLQLKQAALKLPNSEDTVVRSLSEKARELKIEVQNIFFSKRTDLAGRIPGAMIHELPISLKLVSQYNSLGEYLFALRNNFPILIRVRQINIQGNGEGQTNLNVDLEISAYLQ